MSEAPVLFVVGTACTDPGREQEFKDWYDKHHLPEVCARVAGVTRGYRYDVVSPGEGGPTCVAVYELDEQGIGAIERHREKVQRGEAPPYTEGPPFEVKWRYYLRRPSKDCQAW